MCYEALVNGEAREHSVRSVLRRERWDAFVNGLEAAALVLVVLLLQGTPLPILAGATLAAVPAAYVLHQIVMVAGVGLVRARASRA